MVFRNEKILLRTVQDQKVSITLQERIEYSEWVQMLVTRKVPELRRKLHNYVPFELPPEEIRHSTWVILVLNLQRF